MGAGLFPPLFFVMKKLLPIFALCGVILPVACSLMDSPEIRWIKQAEKFALCIVNDPVDRSEAQLLVVDKYLKIDRPDLAIESGDKITTWMRLKAWLNVAVYYEEIGDSKSAEKWFRIFAANLETVKGEPRSSLTAEFLKTLVELDKSNYASLVEGADLPLDEDDAFTVKCTKAVDLAREGQFEEAINIVSGMSHLRIFIWKKQIAQTLQDIENVAQAQGNEAARLLALNAKIKFIEGLPASDHFPLVGELARDSLLEGQLDVGRAYAEQLDTILERDDKKGLAGAIARSGLAILWQDLGEAERARELAEQSDALLRQEEGILPHLRHFVILRLTGIYLRLGDQEKSQYYVQECLEIMRGAGGLRSKCNFAVHTCLKLADHADETISPEISVQMKQFLDEMVLLSEKYPYKEKRTPPSTS
jgi:tetratricopeptide (TPR) repeat protein